MNAQSSDTAATKNDDQRKTARYPFGILQQIAGVVGGELPAPDAFKRVQVIEVSRGGFSFYLPTEPDNDELVIALDDPPDVVYLTARVVYTRMIERWGHEFFRIGCKFTGRVQLAGSSLVPCDHADCESAFMLLSNLVDDV